MWCNRLKNTQKSEISEESEFSQNVQKLHHPKNNYKFKFHKNGIHEINVTFRNVLKLINLINIKTTKNFVHVAIRPAIQSTETNKFCEKNLFSRILCKA